MTRSARELVRAQSDRKIAEARLQRLLHRDDPVGAQHSACSSSPMRRSRCLIGLPLPNASNPILAAFDAQARAGGTGHRDRGSRAGSPKCSHSVPTASSTNYQTLIEPDWAAGIGVNFTLFSRVDRASKVSAARADCGRFKRWRTETRNDIDTAVETVVSQGRAGARAVRAPRFIARGGHENPRLRERGFDEGQATSLDVNDARNAVARAETARAAAAYEFVVALAQLLEASGQAQRSSRAHPTSRHPITTMSKSRPTRCQARARRAGRPRA